MNSSMKRECYIQVNGFTLFVKLHGEKMNKPTVILEAGYGDNSNTWDPIVSEISKITEVLIYDRAGVGKSDESPNRRTSGEMVKELRELLRVMRIKPPYILVGHSFGGVNARIYATNYPDEVAGLVLVDSTPEEYQDRFLPMMPKTFQEAYNKQFILESTYAEFMESLTQLKHSKKLLDVPLQVLSAGKKAHYSKEAQNLWHEMQQEILAISTRGELLIAEQSTHYIHHDEPEIVIDAIKRLVF